jgi:hypothetical protein
MKGPTGQQPSAKGREMKPRNDQAYALRLRAGNAGCAVAVDTRPKSVPNKRRKNDRKATKAALKKSLRTGRLDS